MFFNGLNFFRILKLEQFKYFSETHKAIFKTLNLIALFCSLMELTFAVIKMSEGDSIWNILSYIPPVIICITVHLLVINESYNSGLSLSFLGVPAAIVFICSFDNSTGVYLFILCYAATVLFTIRDKSIMLFYFIFNCICFIYSGVFLINNSSVKPSYSQILLLSINYSIFLLIFYVTLNYIRSFIKKSKIQIRKNKDYLKLQNDVLERQNVEIIQQSHLLEIKNNSILEANNFTKNVTAVLTHDVRTPITSIRFAISSYLSGKISQESILNYLPSIEKEMIYMNQLFEDLLEWSKQQHIDEKSQNHKAFLYNVSNEICEAYSLPAQLKSITIVNDIQKDITALVNSNHFKVVLRNLISNALKFSNRGGIIHLKSSTEGVMYLITVSDNGIGISPEKLEKMNKGMETTSNGTQNETGVGLGLFFCRDYVRKMGGRLFIESQQYKGSKVGFTVPVSLESNTNRDVHSNEKN